MPGLRLPALALLVALVTACGGGVPSSSGETGSGTPAPATGTTAPTGEPTVDPLATPGSEEPGSPAATVEPPASGDPVPSEEPSASEAPSEEPSEATAGSADACSGSAQNREFFEGIARAVEWPVLCGVLPRGWFVSEGAYRLANGGKLVISYKGPGGASITLSEGAYCAADDGCVPAGAGLGSAALGPLDATLIKTADGYALVAAPGENPGWLLEAEGLDMETTVALGAALAEVGR